MMIDGVHIFPLSSLRSRKFLQPAILIKLVDIEIMQFATSTDEPRVVHVVLEKANLVPCNASSTTLSSLCAISGVM